MSQKIRVFNLRAQTEPELASGLDKLKQELHQLRVAKIAGGTASKLGRIRQVRKAIAKHLTVANEKLRAQTRKDLEGKLLPKTLRAKRTRAIRQRLTKAQDSALTTRQQKRATNFPLRKFAVRA